MTKPICLITGVGDGTGSAIARKFSQGGYRVAMIARNRDRLQALEQELPQSKAYACDIGDLEALLSTLKKICSEMGQPSVLIHNAVSATFGRFLEADPEDLERNFRVNTTSLLYMARELSPSMIAAGNGAIVVPGNTIPLPSEAFPAMPCLHQPRLHSGYYRKHLPVIWGQGVFMSPM